MEGVIMGWTAERNTAWNLDFIQGKTIVVARVRHFHPVFPLFRGVGSQQRRWLQCRQAVESLIGALKVGHRKDRCWLKRSESGALLMVLCAAEFNVRRLLRAIARYGLKAVYLCLIGVTAIVVTAVKWADDHQRNDDLRLAHAMR